MTIVFCYALSCVSQGLNVLVVDDSSISRKMVCKLLIITKQCLCDQAADGAIAVDMVQQRITGIQQTCIMNLAYPSNV